MTYSTALPPALVSGRLNSGPRRWSYTEASLAASALDAAGYITNGYHLGMRVGDIVEHYDQNTKIISSHVVISSNATTGAVDLGNGTTIGDATNSD
jgi:hypothetical protein